MPVTNPESVKHGPEVPIVPLLRQEPARRGPLPFGSPPTLGGRNPARLQISKL